jgi:hypothetical protein
VHPYMSHVVVRFGGDVRLGFLQFISVVLHSMHGSYLSNALFHGGCLYDVACFRTSHTYFLRSLLCFVTRGRFSHAFFKEINYKYVDAKNSTSSSRLSLAIPADNLEAGIYRVLQTNYHNFIIVIPEEFFNYIIKRADTSLPVSVPYAAYLFDENYPTIIKSIILQYHNNKGPPMVPLPKGPLSNCAYMLKTQCRVVPRLVATLRVPNHA